ncbi:YdeI family protein [Aquimarina sp. I32.4]|uniref:YdeI/OmpD-associated family protein n=1 Tax=Aquimarina sp. I32.4 TaxID=2053903 RepID=UPI000CDEDB90|nr:DUF1801 domain-containing protein [Aquimarina sp. I32.4]
MKKNKPVEEFIAKNLQWQEELKLLRSIMLATEVEESIKWGTPVYTINDKNVMGLGAFKSYVGIWFYQGVFLEDKKKKLINAQEGKTKGLRQWRFTGINDIDKGLVLSYVKEAISNQKAGKEIKKEKSTEIKIPSELLNVLNNNENFKKAFERLTLFKQKEYTAYITDAKRETTRLSRLEKVKPMIIEGIGLNDKYR